MRRFILPVLALLSVVPLVGCSRGPRLHPVEGKVLWRGKPASGARVIFHPVSDTPNLPQPSGLVGDDGSFHLRTYIQESRDAEDGAPPGEYKVTFDWSDVSPAAASADRNDEAAQPTDKLGGRYADPNRSAFRVTVKEGDNALPPFELK